MNQANVVGKRTLVARTCVRCGKLLDASWFLLKKEKGVRRHECIACERDWRKRLRSGWTHEQKETRSAKRRNFGQAGDLASQLKTLETATSTGQEWTERDYQVLADQTLTRLDKAVALNRTFYSVKTKLVRCGFKSKRGKGDPNLVRWIIDNPNIPADTEAQQRVMLEMWLDYYAATLTRTTIVTSTT